MLLPRVEGMLKYELLPQGHTVFAVVYATRLQKLFGKSGRDNLQCT